MGIKSDSVNTKFLLENQQISSTESSKKFNKKGVQLIAVRPYLTSLYPPYFLSATKFIEIEFTQ
ncbi:hypothetical protein ASG14_05935 [Pedobacter sp. Leaf194]|nr:hypothetical protein ASG14_05935 [Pedobacter sp. Leaf194]